MNETIKKEIESELAILKIQMKKEEDLKKKSIEDTINEITPTEGEVKVEDVKLPINTNPKVLHVKFPYKEYAYITLESNFDQQDNKHNKERYIYDDKLNFVEIAKALGGTRQTISKNIKKLEAEGVMIKDPINPKVYKIKYTFEGKGDYITIHKDILQKLVDVYNSEVIAAYCLFCVELRQGPKKMFRKDICEKLGLNVTKRNLDKISNITDSLENDGLIGKESEYYTQKNKDNYKQLDRKESVIYTLASYEQYKHGIFRIKKAMKDKTKLEKKGIEI